MENSIPEYPESCLRSPAFQKARETLLPAIKSHSLEDFPDIGELQDLLYANCNEENIFFKLEPKCERKLAVRFNVSLEGIVRYEFAPDNDGYPRMMLSRGLYPEGQVIQSVPSIDFSSKSSRIMFELLMPDEQRAMLRYAFAARLKGLRNDFEQSKKTSGKMQKVLDSMSNLHDMYARVMAEAAF